MFEWTMNLTEYGFKWYREASTLEGKVYKIWHPTSKRGALIEEITPYAANIIKRLMMTSCADLVVRF